MKYFILLSTFFLLSCSNKKATEPAVVVENVTDNITTLSDAQLTSANLTLGKLERKSISTTVKLNGKIDVPPQNMISVSVPLGGYLKSTKLLPGMHVSKGEVIAMIEDQQYIQLQQDFLTTKNKLLFAEAEYQRQKELNTSKASSDKVFQQTEMEYKSLRIMLSALTEKLKLIGINAQGLSENNISNHVKIYSQISGYVSKVNVNIGKYVNPTDVLFELLDPSDFHLNLTVFEKDIDKLSIGQHLLAYTNNQPSKKYQSEIILISKDISPERTVQVHCHFEHYDKALLPGMYMNAEIDINSSSTPSLPEDAIVNFEGENYVFIALSKNQFKMEKVEIGTKENGFVAIKNHEAFANKQIVIKGAYTLLMKLKNKAEEE